MERRKPLRTKKRETPVWPARTKANSGPAPWAFRAHDAVAVVEEHQEDGDAAQGIDLAQVAERGARRRRRGADLAVDAVLDPSRGYRAHLRARAT